MNTVQAEGEIINAGIAKMVADPALKLEFMKAMSGNADEIAEFYVKNFDAPQDLADTLASKSSQQLWNYIGERVCVNLW